jgi:hypothetical protein
VQGYQSVLADVATYTGMLTLGSMVVSRLVFQYAGWGVAAAVTPAVMGLAGVVFFGATLASQLPALTPEMAATIAGVGATAGVVTQVGVAGHAGCTCAQHACCPATFPCPGSVLPFMLLAPQPACVSHQKRGVKSHRQQQWC